MAELLEHVALAFDSNDACRIAQITNRQLNHWDRLGIASPSINAGRGSGNRRAYRLADVIMLRLASELRQFGVRLNVVADAIATVRRTGAIDAPASDPDSRVDSDSIHLAVGGDGIFVVGQRLDSQLLSESASMIVVRLDRITELVKHQVCRERETTQLRRTPQSLRTPALISPSHNLAPQDVEPPVIEPLDVEPLGEVGQFEAIANALADVRKRDKHVHTKANVVPDRTKRQVEPPVINRTIDVAPSQPKQSPRLAPNPQRPPGASAWGDAW